MSQSSDQIFSGFDPTRVNGSLSHESGRDAISIALQPNASLSSGERERAKNPCGCAATIRWPNVESRIDSLSPRFQGVARYVQSTARVAGERIDHFDEVASGLMMNGGTALLRFGLGVVFIWFGILKPFGMSPAADLVAKTVYWGVDPAWFIPVLGWWEVLIGVCLIDPGCRMGLGRLLTRLGVILILPQMAGTFLPLFILPEITWQDPFVLTMEGQYIVKNLVLIGAALYLGGRARQDEDRNQ